MWFIWQINLLLLLLVSRRQLVLRIWLVAHEAWKLHRLWYKLCKNVSSAGHSLFAVSKSQLRATHVIELVHVNVLPCTLVSLRSSRYEVILMLLVCPCLWVRCVILIIISSSVLCLMELYDIVLRLRLVLSLILIGYHVIIWCSTRFGRWTLLGISMNTTHIKRQLNALFYYI